MIKRPMEKRFGLLGERLEHSFSPQIHALLGGYEYRLYEIAPSGLDAFMIERRFDGINVTIPYKQAVIPYCARLSDEARKIGSVNTIIKDADGLLSGHNTDYFGFYTMLEHANIDPSGKKALVLGDGGAARTVRAVLAGAGAREIVTLSRRGEDNYNNVDRHFDADIIVNTTPVGMYPDNGNSPLSLTGFTRLCGVADLIYNPMRTKLLLEAERLGVNRANGLIMLVAQAEAASRLFTGEPSHPAISASLANTAHQANPAHPVHPANPVHPAYPAHPAQPGEPSHPAHPGQTGAIAAAIAARTRNIAIIGMPGSGKSTLGRLLAQKEGRPFSDTDALIQKAAGKPIAKIFEEDGESAFRKLETAVLADEAKKSGIVIATGGGVVTRPENLDLLRQNSLIIYLKRELSGLATYGRPLSTSTGVRTLADQRLPLYESWRDAAVSAISGDPEATAEMALKIINEVRGG